MNQFHVPQYAHAINIHAPLPNSCASISSKRDRSATTTRREAQWHHWHCRTHIAGFGNTVAPCLLCKREPRSPSADTFLLGREVTPGVHATSRRASVVSAKELVDFHFLPHSCVLWDPVRLHAAKPSPPTLRAHQVVHHVRAIFPVLLFHLLHSSRVLRLEFFVLCLLTPRTRESVRVRYKSPPLPSLAPSPRRGNKVVLLRENLHHRPLLALHFVLVLFKSLHILFDSFTSLRGRLAWYIPEMSRAVRIVSHPHPHHYRLPHSQPEIAESCLSCVEYFQL